MTHTRTRRRPAVLLCAAAAALVMQVAGAPRAHAASAVRTSTRAVLAAACEGNVDRSGRGCSRCPSFVDGDPGAVLEVGATIRVGAYTGPGRSEAMVDLAGCEPHAGNYGGTVLLRADGAKWSVVRYESGLRTYDCLGYSYDVRTDLLVCRDEWNGQGYTVESVYAVYAGPDRSTTRSVARVQSDVASCNPRSSNEVSIKSWQRKDLDGDGRADLRIEVTESRGLKTDDQDECDPAPDQRVQRQRLDFLHDGRRLDPTSGAAATVACLARDVDGRRERDDVSLCPLARTR